MFQELMWKNKIEQFGDYKRKEVTCKCDLFSQLSSGHIHGKQRTSLPKNVLK